MMLDVVMREMSELRLRAVNSCCVLCVRRENASIYCAPVIVGVYFNVIEVYSQD